MTCGGPRGLERDQATAINWPGEVVDYVPGRDTIPGEDGYGAGTRRPGIYAAPDPAIEESAADAWPGSGPMVAQPCEVCGVLVAADYIRRTGWARHGWHPEVTVDDD